MRALLLFALFPLSIVAGASAQSNDVGKEVYSATENSVFLVYLNNSAGSPTALGSAFVVKPRILITNAHVADAGDPVLAVGPIRVPLKVVRIDRSHDLAELSVDLDLVSKPLTLSDERVKPGEQVFAIGNPEGLEKTISQGIVSGLRKRDGNDLIQISSPISHGSSGGPILNDKGEVIGVAVGTLDQGQNLDFAVPVEFVKALLDAKTQNTTSLTSAESIDHIRDLVEQRNKTEYSSDSGSEYQKLTSALTESVESLLNSTSDPRALQQLSCFGANQWDLIDFGVDAARKLAKTKPTTENQALLAYLLDSRADHAELAATIAADGSDEKNKALAERDKFIAEAGATATAIGQSARGDTLLLVAYVLGDSKDTRGDTAGAITLHAKAASGNLRICDKDLTQETLQSLVRENSEAKHPEEAEKWFRTYSARYTPAAYEWDSEGDRREAMNDHANAAEAYEKAARDGSYYSYDYCYAARAHHLQVPLDEDSVLADGKLCVGAAVKNTAKSSEPYFTEQVPAVYAYMAQILEGRGVYQTALEYLKESLRVKPDYAYAMDMESDIYFTQQRYSECESVESEAIRISDGKFPFMQFRLGTCYFGQGNWAMAENSFRLAAEADKTDAPAAFNLGLSLSRQGISTDAQIWFSEALKRNPDPELRAKIQSAMQH